MCQKQLQEKPFNVNNIFWQQSEMTYYMCFLFGILCNLYIQLNMFYVERRFRYKMMVMRMFVLLQ